MPLSTAFSVSADRPAANQIVERLRTAIVRLELPPGQMLSESDLAERFGVSRTPVREALIKLAQQGFIEVRPQRGTFITKIRPKELLEARFIREAIETAGIERIVGRLDQATISKCRLLLEDQKAAASAEDVYAFHRADDAFHRALAEATGFERLSSLIEGEKALMDRVRILSLKTTPPFKRLISQHKAILDAVVAGDRQKALSHMRKHLRELLTTLPQASRDHPQFFTETIDPSSDWAETDSGAPL
ncbi:GntR family transcriptional regulator [Pelagibius sp. Alg239-R121]|uniref:GntR family transcriptional regulator n=1 Tax=Pelagibius sp. Alg239-R121 TaxID=2993448 RepID=UPI0024A6CAA4|nr:GntR family transcriptional regulator [Pelagibius sp. Alg239-R121]